MLTPEASRRTSLRSRRRCSLIIPGVDVEQSYSPSFEKLFALSWIAEELAGL